jgi:sulfonate transport system substrate-binding protein
VASFREAISQTGVIQPDTQARSLAFLQKFDDELKVAKVDLSKTWDGRFVAKAAETIK